MESSRFLVLAFPVLCLPGGAGRLLTPPVARFAGASRPGLRLTVAQPPAAAADGPGPWVAWEDDATKVDVYKVIYWSSTEALELMRETPPPPLGVHDVGRLVNKLEQLKQSAETESLEPYSATRILLLNHWYLWEAYGVEPVKGYSGPEMFLHDCVKFACGADGYVLYDYLHAFGLRFGAMPASDMDKDLIAAILYVSKAKREYVGKYRERLRKLQMRKHWEASDKERKEAAEEEAAWLEEEQEASGDFPELGPGGV
uniref:Uncharacterized protein n=1 Tax=Oryza punctata TaxID=4537 RepID=A0A0E0LDB3_ORYPU